MSPFLIHMNIKDKIENAVNEWIGSTDCFLVDVKIAPSRVAVFIDKPTGVTLDECSSLNKFITNALEPENVWETHELEVSSPGMDQPMKVYQQYLRRIGRDIKVITLDGKEMKGKLKSANEFIFICFARVTSVPVFPKRSIKENASVTPAKLEVIFNAEVYTFRYFLPSF